MSPRSIVLTNGFDDTNLGGAAITLATSDLARQIDPTANLSFICVNERADLRFNGTEQPDLRVLPPPFGNREGRLNLAIDLMRSLALIMVPSIAGRNNSTIEALRGANLVISKGGYVYRERGSIRGLAAGWFTMWPLMFGKRCGARSIIYSASIGPFTSRASRLLSRFALRRSDVICPRDLDSSARCISELGLNDSDTESMSDCVFGLFQDERIVANKYRRHARRVVLVPRVVPLGNWSDMVKRFRHAVEFVRPEEVVIALQADSDRPAAVLLSQELGLEQGCIEETLTPLDATSVYQTASLVVTGRLHGAILSLLTETPTVMLEIPDEVGKSQPVLGDVVSETLVVPLEGPDHLLIDAIERALLPDFTRNLADRLAETKQSVKDVNSRLADRFGWSNDSHHGWIRRSSHQAENSTTSHNE